jgi:DNA-directed RNA polymerase specialized sigma24 family protein
MGWGRGQANLACVCAPGDELGALALKVVDHVHPNQHDRANADDVFQAAYIAGMTARASAQRRHAQICGDLLFKAMRQAAFRALRGGRRIVREADL